MTQGNNSNKASGSQKTQNTNQTNTETLSDDQKSQLIIQKLSKTSQNGSWSEKQSILSGQIIFLATNQTGSKYL